MLVLCAVVYFVSLSYSTDHTKWREFVVYREADGKVRHSDFDFSIEVMDDPRYAGMLGMFARGSRPAYLGTFRTRVFYSRQQLDGLTPDERASVIREALNQYVTDLGEMPYGFPQDAVERALIERGVYTEYHFVPIVVILQGIIVVSFLQCVRGVRLMLRARRSG